MSFGMPPLVIPTYTKRPKAMKRPILLVLGTSLALCAGAWAETAKEGVATKVATLYKQGLEALEEGDATLARQCFTAVLQIQPSHGNARYQLLHLKQRGPQLAATVRKKKLAQVKIPKVDFEDTTVPDAIEALGILIEKETEGKFAPNFIVQDPQSLFDSRPLTMKLGTVPASVVLEYILRMGDAKVRYDEFAIVIRPLGGGTASPKAGSGQENADGGADPFAK